MDMTKLTKEEAPERLEAALAMLGEEDCEDGYSNHSMNWARHVLKRALQEPGVMVDTIANDIVVH